MDAIAEERQHQRLRQSSSNSGFGDRAVGTRGWMRIACS